LVSDIPGGDGKTANLFLQCIMYLLFIWVGLNDFDGKILEGVSPEILKKKLKAIKLKMKEQKK
jgi:hypothetical protein